MKESVYLHDLGILSAQAQGKRNVFDAILKGSRQAFSSREFRGKTYQTAMINRSGMSVHSPYADSVIEFAGIICEEIYQSVASLIQKYGKKRIGVIVGSTAIGNEPSLAARQVWKSQGHLPDDYLLKYQQADSLSSFIKNFFQLESLSASISTACTSGSSAVVMAHKFLCSGSLDAVIAGGIDSNPEAVFQGFISLGAVDPVYSIPFSKNRNGINLGEGGALFVLSRQKDSDTAIEMIGYGESTDAYHSTAPDPKGQGAISAMKQALAMANYKDIDYINLHGTGTELNDKMEASATSQVFANVPPCSSTKGITGHTLGAAGAIELGICWLLLSQGGKTLPPHLWDGIADPTFPELPLVSTAGTPEVETRTCMSNSYAFGGSNVSIILSKGRYR